MCDALTSPRAAMKRAPSGRRAYGLVRPLGEGSFGSVSLVAHKVTGDEVVIKEVRLKGLSRPALQAAREEVLVLQRLDHPHIIAYREAFVEEVLASLFIVTEYADGGDLLARIKAKKTAGSVHFAEAEMVRMFAQCVDALAYCHHQLHLLHRDLKPANIFLTGPEDSIKIGDFGISRSLASTNAMAQTKCGTALYMAPEICEGSAYGRAADVWALAVTFYEASSLKEPWLDMVTGGGMMGLYRTIMTRDLDLAVLGADGGDGGYSGEWYAVPLALLTPPRPPHVPHAPGPFTTRLSQNPMLHTLTGAHCSARCLHGRLTRVRPSRSSCTPRCASVRRRSAIRASPQAHQHIHTHGSWRQRKPRRHRRRHRPQRRQGRRRWTRAERPWQ